MMPKHTIVVAVWIVLAVASSACSTHHADKDPVDTTATSVDTAAVKDSIRRAKKFNAEGIDTTTFHVTDSSVSLKNSIFPTPGGRVVNIMITGVDSRLGDPMGHADANHLVRFFLDSGFTEIISIPRDTYYDAGFDDSTGLNKLTNVRANRGRTAYLNAVADIAGVPKVDHWVEFGFSQAIGLLELMGYRDNASNTLRVLRSRQAYGSGDFQRSYNQGQFIRQVLLRHFDNTDGIIGDIVLRAALSLVDTDLTYDRCSYILDELRTHGFGNEPRKAWVRLRPTIVAKFTVYDFDKDNVNEINAMISHKIKRLGLDSIPITEETYERKLNRLVDKAALDSAKSAASVIRLLRRPYEQRAWLQVPDREKRREYRNRMCGLLMSAYRRTKNVAAVTRIQQFIEIDDRASGNP